MNKEYERIREAVGQFVTSAMIAGYNARANGEVWEQEDGSVILPKSLILINAIEILSIKGIAIKRDDQMKPEPNIDIHLWRDYSPSEAYQEAQDDMQIAGFVKVVKGD